MNLRFVLLGAATIVGLGATVALTAPYSALTGSVSVCDPYSPMNCLFPTSGGALIVTQVPSPAVTVGNPYVKTAAVASSLVLKAGAGNFYGANVTSGASAGFVLLHDAIAAPVNGAVTPVKCWVLPANSSVGVSANPPIVFPTGMTLTFSTTGCFNQTLSATAFMSGEVQ